jgi:hypothetical protein
VFVVYDVVPDAGGKYMEKPFAPGLSYVVSLLLQMRGYNTKGKFEMQMDYIYRQYDENTKEYEVTDTMTLWTNTKHKQAFDNSFSYRKNEINMNGDGAYVVDKHDTLAASGVGFVVQSFIKGLAFLDDAVNVSNSIRSATDLIAAHLDNVITSMYVDIASPYGSTFGLHAKFTDLKIDQSQVNTLEKDVKREDTERKSGRVTEASTTKKKELKLNRKPVMLSNADEEKTPKQDASRTPIQIRRKGKGKARYDQGTL